MVKNRLIKKYTSKAPINHNGKQHNAYWRRRRTVSSLKVKSILYSLHFCLIFRHFEEWIFNGQTFDVVELEAMLDGYSLYPESYYINDIFCH